jgi:cell division protein FtsW (lipid II flippase)
VFVIMLYLATERASWLIFGVLMFVIGAALVALLFSHVQVRFESWLNPFGDVSGNSRQTAQSLYAFANGGLFGTGIDQGYPYLVGFANNADFIMDTVGEELGLVGLTAILIGYALFVGRGLKTALLVRDPYGKLFASGLAVVFALQVFITAGGVMRVIPLTGLPMPFLAYGGSALLANWVLAALLMRVSDAARRPLPPALPLTAPPSLLDPRSSMNNGRGYGQNKAVQT